MKQYRMLFIFIALMLTVSLACNGGSDPTTVAPTTSVSVPNPPSNNGNPPANNPPVSNGGSSDVITVEDQN